MATRKPSPKRLALAARITRLEEKAHDYELWAQSLDLEVTELQQQVNRLQDKLLPLDKEATR